MSAVSVSRYSIVLGAIGGVVGLVAGFFASRMLVRWLELHPEPWGPTLVALFTVPVCLIAGAVVGAVIGCLVHRFLE